MSGRIGSDLFGQGYLTPGSHSIGVILCFLQMKLV